MIAREPTPLEKRVAATQATLDDWLERPLDWSAGFNCARLLAEHLRRMGYTPPLSKAGTFKTPLGAKRALRRLGVDRLGEVLDGMGLTRIPALAAVAGDIIEAPAEDDLGAFHVALGNGRTIGFYEGRAERLQLSEYVAAWRIDPR